MNYALANKELFDDSCSFVRNLVLSNMATPYKRAQPYSDDQKRALIEYMRRNPDLRHSKSCSPFARNKWMEITNDLNKMYGTKKDFKEWRKAWQDLKTRTKMRANRIKSAYQQYDELSAIDQDILQLITPSQNISDPLEITAESNEESSKDTVDNSIEDVKPINTYDFAYGSEIQSDISPHTAIDETSNTANINDAKTLETNGNLPTASDMAIQLELANRNELFKDYHAKKLVFAERVALAQERRALAVERIATAQELIASCKRQCNC